MRTLPILVARLASLTASLAALTLVASVASAAPDPAPGPEVVTSTAVELPPVPAFELPPVVDGVHAVRELRVAGKALLDRVVKVAGYVTSVNGSHLTLGEAKDTAPDASVTVVEVPKTAGAVVGSYVVVTGKLAQLGPHGDRNIDGLLVMTAIAKAAPSAPLVGVVEDKPVIPLVQLKPRAKKPIGAKQQNESADHLSAANKLAGAGKLDEAVAEYELATKGWPDNHLAWYGLGGIHAARGDWAAAVKDFDEAVSIRPDVALYLMWRGIVGFEQGEKLDQSADYLVRAIALAPKMWRAHYYLGKIERDRSHAKRAAEEFTLTLQNNAAEPGPYVALAEQYRKWDYVDQAVAVATQGSANAPKSADVWFVLGMALERKSPAQAIEAFTKSIAAGRAPLIATYERGRMEFAQKDYGKARADLEAYVKSGDKNGAFQIDLANQLIGQIPVKH